MDIDDVYGILGFGRMQHFIFVTCATIQLYVISEQMGLDAIAAASSGDLYMNMTDIKVTWLLVVSSMGSVLFSSYMGNKADKIGRRKIMLITLTVNIIFNVGSSLSPEYYTFLVMRILGGASLSGFSVTYMTYMSEFTRISMRPTVQHSVYYFTGIGMMYVPIMASIVMPLNINIHVGYHYLIRPWRILCLVCQVPGIVALVILFYMPESPKYYLSFGDTNRAMEVLERMCRMNLRGKRATTLEALGITSVYQSRDRSIEVGGCGCRHWDELKPIFMEPYLNYVVIISVITFIQVGIGFGLFGWTLRVSSVMSNPHANRTMYDVIQEYGQSGLNLNTTMTFEGMEGNILHGAAVMVGLLLATVVMYMTTRRIIVFWYTVIGVCGGLCLNVAVHQQTQVCMFLLFVVAPLCSFRMTVSLIIDLLPTSLRAKAVAVVMMAGSLGISVITLFVGFTVKLNSYVTFNILVVALMGSAVLLCLLPKCDDLHLL